MRKSADGFAVLSKVHGRTYTVDVPGRDIKTFGEQSADHPYLAVDGRFLQVLSVPLAEFHGSASGSDEAVLKQQMQYETAYWRVPAVQPQVRKLPSGSTALLWSMSAHSKRQLFCTVRSGSYVLVLGSSPETGPQCFRASELAFAHSRLAPRDTVKPRMGLTKRCSQPLDGVRLHLR